MVFLPQERAPVHYNTVTEMKCNQQLSKAR